MITFYQLSIYDSGDRTEKIEYSADKNKLDDRAKDLEQYYICRVSTITFDETNTKANQNTRDLVNALNNVGIPEEIQEEEIEKYGDVNQGLGTWNGYEYVRNK